VELAGPDLLVPLGHGRPHLRRVLTALALYAPAVPGAGRAPAAPPANEASSLGPRRLREIRVPLV
jgi:hypothetical protein